MGQATFDRYLTEAEERAFFKAVRARAGVLARRDRHAFELMRRTGFRVGSVAGITCGEAREALRTDHLAANRECAKGGRGYTVLATKGTKRALMRLLAIRREMGFAEAPDAPLVMGRKGRGLSVRSFQARMAYWVGQAGLNVPATPHWWRHTLAHRLTRNSTAKDPLGVAQRTLGHKSRATTGIYALPSREEAEAALREVA